MGFSDTFAVIGVVLAIAAVALQAGVYEAAQDGPARAAAIPAKPPPMMTTRFCFVGAASGRDNFSGGRVSSNAVIASDFGLIACCTVMVCSFVSQLRLDPPAAWLCSNWRGTIRQARVDGGRAAQGLTDGAPLGDREQPQPLFFGEIAIEMNGAMKVVDRRLAIRGRYLFVPQFDCRPAQPPVMPLDIGSQRHGGARAESGQQVFVRRRTDAATSARFWLVGGQDVPARVHQL